MAIQFPANPAPGQQYTPTGSTIIYIYDVDRGWLVAPGEVNVNKEYVDAQDFLKYDKSGGKVSGDLSVGETEYSEDVSNFEITRYGEVKFKGVSPSRGDLSIQFIQPNNKRGRLTTKIGNNPERKLLEFGNEIRTFATIDAYAIGEPIISFDSPVGRADVIVLDCPQSSAAVNAVIKLSNTTNAELTIRADVEDVVTIGGNGRLEVRGNDRGTFAVYRKSDGEEILNVDPDTFKITASQSFDQGLVKGTHEVVRSNGQTVRTNYNEDELLATMGAVRRYQFIPGEQVFAESEADAEVYGMWTDGTNFYIRYK